MRPYSANVMASRIVTCRARRPLEQEQPARGERGHVDGLGAGEGAERGEGQGAEPHATSRQRRCAARPIRRPRADRLLDLGRPRTADVVDEEAVDLDPVGRAGEPLRSLVAGLRRPSGSKPSVSVCGHTARSRSIGGPGGRCGHTAFTEQSARAREIVAGPREQVVEGLEDLLEPRGPGSQGLEIGDSGTVELERTTTGVWRSEKLKASGEPL